MSILRSAGTKFGVRKDINCGTVALIDLLFYFFLQLVPTLDSLNLKIIIFCDTLV